MRRRLVCVLLLLFTVLDASAPRAQDSLDIVAVVNDAAITKVDLLVRLQLVIRTSGLQDYARDPRQAGTQVLRALIDERLKRQAVQSAGITASREEVVRALTRFAAANRHDHRPVQCGGRAGSAGRRSLHRRGDRRHRLAKAHRREARPDGQCHGAGRRRGDCAGSQARGKPEYLVAEIFIGVDQPQQDAAAKQSADR